MDFRKHTKHRACFVLFPGVRFFIKCWKCLGLEGLFPWLHVAEKQDMSRHPSTSVPCTQKVLFLFQGDQHCGMQQGQHQKGSQWNFPGTPYTGFESLCDISNSKTWHFLSSKARCDPCKCLLLVSAIRLVPAILPFKSPYPPIFSSTDTLGLGCSGMDAKKL